jgi:AcrR family transcriptional regulator
MRALARAAGASLSSTNYHYGTKEALLEAVLRRRAEPLNGLRLERLGREESAAGDAPVALEAILEAFVVPLFEMRAGSEDSAARPAWVGARLFFDPSPVVSRMRAELFREVDARFLGALERALPGQARSEIEVAYQLTNGLFVHFAAGHVVGDLSEAAAGTEDSSILDQLLAYAGAGLRNLEKGASR